MAVAHRDISPLLQKIRNFLLGRELKLALRFSDEMSTRSPPLPKLPGGPSHKLYQNYYVNRDGRREVNPPVVLVENMRRKVIGSAERKDRSLHRLELGKVTPGKQAS
ncbi:NADH dehydrogenase [ubiquinone] 1 alpha subcomplex subunit 7-like [Tachypleus tridentatus]|uniref:NADH dehydrogenase [ubiquinone] 1 alpha subcomplex subunit 7-like n=1 Tax=Tachypleus tridentatus TaxID=6853 RepID=UPI003FD251F8